MPEYELSPFHRALLPNTLSGFLPKFHVDFLSMLITAAKNFTLSYSQPQSLLGLIRPPSELRKT